MAGGALSRLGLPALLKLWPLPRPGERRARLRLDAMRALCWWPYCGLFATLYFPPVASDLIGIARFLGLSVAVGAFCVLAGWFLRRRGAEPARVVYRRAIAPFAGLVLALVVLTSIFLR